MNDREEWRERVRDIRATSAIWWWWWWWYVCVCVCVRACVCVSVCLSLYLSVCVWKRCRCYGYCRTKWTGRHEFKSWTRLFAFHRALIPLVKVWIQLFSLRLCVNSRAGCFIKLWCDNWSKKAKLRLKLTLCHILLVRRGKFEGVIVILLIFTGLVKHFSLVLKATLNRCHNKRR